MDGTLPADVIRAAEECSALATITTFINR